MAGLVTPGKPNDIDPLNLARLDYITTHGCLKGSLVCFAACIRCFIIRIPQVKFLPHLRQLDRTDRWAIGEGAPFFPFLVEHHLQCRTEDLHTNRLRPPVASDLGYL